MRHSRVLLSLILLTALAPSVYAAKGNGSLSGTVMAADGKGLFGAVVALFRQEAGSAVVSLTKSDTKGSYSLSEIEPGSYSLRVTRSGYQVLNSPGIAISAGKNITINFVLQEFFDLISLRNDPRNWNLKTVMQSTSGRRMIFRNLPGFAGGETGGGFHRGAAMNVASSTALGNDNYALYPGEGAIISNFAYTEPLSQHSRMIFSGQLNSGYNSLWRVRNTFDYRPDPNRQMKVSVGYGRSNLNRVNAGAVAQVANFFNQDPVRRDSGIETLAMSLEGSNQFLDMLAVEYGLDLSRINYGATKTAWSPYFQILFTPRKGWFFRSQMSSRRFSQNDSIELPDGQVINLLEPAVVSNISNRIAISQMRHSELSVGKMIADDTSIEMTVYRDRVEGPGTPFFITSNTGSGKKTQAAQLRSDQDAQQGMRLAVARMLMESVRGSITYNYGSAAGLSGSKKLLSCDVMMSNLLDFIGQSYYHSVTGQLEARIPRTRTQVQATIRWYPGNPISPIDLFADRLDTVTKGVGFSLRQTIPVPDFMGYAGRWEALIDLRNPFDQGRNIILTTDGELTLTRNPRTLRFGLNLNFN
jgi:hypothetical protein